MNKLYVVNGCPYCLAAMIALDTAGITYELVHTDVKQRHSKEFKAMNPKGTTPVLQTEEGVIYESTAIMRYAARCPESLYGVSNFTQSQVDQWVSNISSTLSPALSSTYNTLLGGKHRTSKDEHTKNVDRAVKDLSYVNTYLKGRDYLVGSGVTIADIYAVVLFDKFLRFSVNPKQRKQCKNIVKYFTNMTQHKVFSKYLRAYEDCGDFCRLHGGSSKNQKNQKQQKKSKKQNQPKQQKAKPKKKKQEFPKSSMNLDEFKRNICNEKDNAKKMEYIKNNFDSNGYSFWKLDYEKIKGELEIRLQSENQLDGFLQRCETFRKHVCGVHALVGKEGDFNMKGVWLWRGTEKLPNLEENPAMEYYKFTKLDINKPEDFKLVEEYFSLEDTDQEKKEIEGNKVVYFDKIH